ncbi:S41 family peptidase [Kangiella sp. HZ709]|uniref:S41 family peptidase n=1 Tax=Kangiella sp. HZ709 TaxID=2666328 RepID=UPI0012AEF262|nr:S41 family peptidase [Kangiella sp. HZ709]MRX27058.1 peptidase [Kangiella sp. HZ709]
MINISKSLLFVLCLALLSSCGSSDNDDSPGNLTWTSGVFEASTRFDARCENPRSGNDINGDPWPDVQGSTLDENFWLRSWSDETYLWYNEIVDQNPANFSSPIAYFEELKTDAVTNSGNARDNFHFTQDTDEQQQEAATGSSAGYGLRFRILSSSPPRRIVIAYNEPNSPASAANVERGAEIITIDGVDVENGADVNALNSGLFPNDGETHTFVIRDLGATTTRTVDLTATTVTSDPVQNETVFNTASGIVGYMQFNTFGTRIAEQELIDAFIDFSNQGVQDLVIDLRYNGGGFLFISSQLAYMVAGPTRTQNKIYGTNVYNDKFNGVDIFGNTNNPTPFFSAPSDQGTAPGGVLPDLNLNRVFVLSTGSTCSASEALINGLRGIDVEVVLIGDTTCGKPYGFFPTDNCGTTYFTIQFREENDKGFGDYADGFIPSATDNGQDFVRGCTVPDDFTKALGDPTEALLAAALNYQATGSCPTSTNKFAPAQPNRANFIQDPLDLKNSKLYKERTFIRDNRIDLRM